MQQIKITIIIYLLISFKMFGQEHLTIQTNLKSINFYDLNNYEVYRDFSDTLNSNTDLRVFIFKKNKVKNINLTNKEQLSIVGNSDWSKFLSRCKSAEQFDMLIYDKKGKEQYSFVYKKGLLNFVEPDIYPLDLNVE